MNRNLNQSFLVHTRPSQQQNICCMTTLKLHWTVSTSVKQLTSHPKAFYMLPSQDIVCM